MNLRGDEMPTLVFCTKCPNATFLDQAYVEDGKIVCGDCKTDKSVKIPDEFIQHHEQLNKCEDDESN